MREREKKECAYVREKAGESEREKGRKSEREKVRKVKVKEGL